MNEPIAFANDGVARLLLVYPTVRHEGRLRYYMTDYAGAEAPGAFVFPPIEMLYVASLARKHGIKVGLVDAAANRKPPEWVVEACRVWRPTHLLFPTPLGEILPAVFDVINAVSKAVPDASIVVFGPEVTISPDLAFKCSAVDAVIIGEPDQAAVDWVLNDNDGPVANLIYRDDPVTPEIRPLGGLDHLPHPARDLLDPRRYYAPFSRTGPYTTVWASRGCGHGCCRFCPSSLWRKSGELVHHSPEYVAEDIRQALALGFREIFFRDQNFTGHPAWAGAVCEKILATGLDVPWRCMTRVDCADLDLFRLMKRAGCYQISLGFESSEQTVLDENVKGIQVSRSFHAARQARDAGIEVVGNFIVGLKGETSEGIKKISRFALDLGCDFAQFHVIVPNPKIPDDIGGGITDRQRRRMVAAQRRAYLRFYLRTGFLVKRLFMLLEPDVFRAALHAAWNIIRYGM